MQYVGFLDSSRYYADVLQRMVDKTFRASVDEGNPAEDQVLKQGHF